MRSYRVDWYHQVPDPVNEIIATLAKAGKKAWVAGGAVRDLLLGATPKDFDIVSDASPEEIEALFPKTLALGKQFGIMVVVTPSANIEIARFRSDGSYADGRRPDAVTFVDDPLLDAERRDFTINALFYDPRAGEILDYVNGKEDFDKRLIRCVGDPGKRFEEDGLRVLRAVRFLAQLGPYQFSLDPNTEQALAAHAARIEKVSKERITQEIEKILRAPDPLPALYLLEKSTLWDRIFFVPFPGDRTLQNFKSARDGAPESKACLAILLSALPDSETAAQSKRLLLSNFEKSAITGIAKARAAIEKIPSGTLADKKLAMVEPFFLEALGLMKAETGAGWLGSMEQEKASFEAAGTLAPPALLNGEDLKQLGVSEGPEIKRILTAVRRAQLEGKIATREEAMRTASTMLSAASGP